MPLTGTEAILSAAIALAATIADPAGLAGASGVAGALVSWITSNAIANNIPPASMTASGAAVTGQGRVSFGSDGNSLGDALAAGVPTADPTSIQKWRDIGNAIHSHITTNGLVNPSTYVAVPTGGPVTGVGTLSFATLTFSPSLASVLGLVDPANQVIFLALETAILGYLAANAQVNSLGFTSPTGGGPLVGASTIS